MEIRELRSFCMAAQLRSISRAADRLDLGQPTVTIHIKKLETELGLPLFDRMKRPIQLTATGTLLADLATPLVDEIDAMFATAAGADVAGPVTVGATHEIIPHVLLPAVEHFHDSNPDSRIFIRSGRRDAVIQMVEEREVDIGIIPGIERAPGLEFSSLFRYERVLITPLDHPLVEKPLESLTEIANYPLIMMEPDTYTRANLEAEFRQRGVNFEVVMELGNMDYITRYVAAGMGVSVGPRLAIDPEDQTQLGMIDLSHLIAIDQAGSIVLEGRRLPKSGEQFMDSLKTIFTN